MTNALDTKAARDAILGKVRRVLEAGETDPNARTKAVTQRIAQHKRGILPKKPQVSLAERRDLFMSQIEGLSGTAQHITSAKDAPAAIAAYLKKHNLPAQIRTGSDDRLARLDWTKVPTLKIHHGPAEDNDLACLTHAISGVAETGTVVLTSSADNPTSLNFMPDHSIVLVDGKTIDASYEDGFDRIRKNQPKDTPLPRSINFITGPSRTADIEQVIYFGAHGPKYLHVIVVD